jgi:hypothetical protein
MSTVSLKELQALSHGSGNNHVTVGEDIVHLSSLRTHKFLGHDADHSLPSSV